MTTFSLRQQYEEVELVYLERRNALAEAERCGRLGPEALALKTQRLFVLRQARHTLFRLAQERPDRFEPVAPQDADTGERAA